MSLAEALVRLRRSLPGELAWVAFLTVALAVHAGSLVSPLLKPDMTDFAAFAASAEAWQHGRAYPPEFHDPNTPLSALLVLPFARLPLGAGLVGWMAFNYVCGLIALRIIAREAAIAKNPPVRLTLFALWALMPMTQQQLINANMVWIVWLLVTIAWQRSRQRPDAVAGILLGVSSVLKPFIGLWWATLAWIGARRAFVAMTIAAAVVLASTTMIVGVPTWIAWREAVARNPFYDAVMNGSLWILAVALSPSHVPIAFGMFVAVVLITSALVVRRAKHADAVWLIVLLAALLIQPLSWRYYGVLALGPLACWWPRRRESILITTLIAGWLYLPGAIVPAIPVYALLLSGSWIAAVVGELRPPPNLK